MLFILPRFILIEQKGRNIRYILLAELQVLGGRHGAGAELFFA
jgi:hypothetical protein